MSRDLRIPAQERLLAQIIASDEMAALGVTNVVLGPPVPSNDVPGTNTKSTLTLYRGNVPLGPRTFYYQRLDLTAALGGSGALGNLNISNTTINQTHDILPLLLEQLGVSVMTNDVVNQSVSDPTNFTLAAASDSYGFIATAVVSANNVETLGFSGKLLRTQGSQLVLAGGLFLRVSG